MKRGMIWETGFIFLLILNTSAVVMGQDEPPEWVQKMQTTQEGPLIQKIVTEGSIALVNWIHGYIEVAGEGSSKKTGHTAQQILNAKDAARTMAYAKLAETVNGVIVRGASNVRDSLLEGQIAQRLLKDTLIKNAVPLKEGYRTLADGTIIGIVKLGYFLNGQQGLSKFLANKQVHKAATEGQKKFTPNQQKKSEKPFTGLIVDAGGIGGKPAMYPHILAKGSNRVVYSADLVSDQSVVVNGAARYARSVAAAKNIKDENGAFIFGENPMVVKGVGVSDRSSIAISIDDASKVFNADLKDRFLQAGKVAIVLN